MDSLQGHFTRRRLLEAIAGLGAFGLAGGAQAQTDKVMRFILPNATGSGVDAITRSAQNALGKALGALVVIDNQPGAGGIVGLQALARSAPDGNTLSVVSNNVVIFPSVYKSLPFNMPGPTSRRSRCAASRRSCWSSTRRSWRPTPGSSLRCSRRRRAT
jgi:tripartite-type tricarboxylate transporter receptor subunit TctC